MWKENETIRQKFGSAVALAARDLVTAEQRTADAIAVADYERKRIDTEMSSYRDTMRKKAESEAGEWIAIRNEILDWLELDGNIGLWAVRRRIGDLMSACDADARVLDADKRLEEIRRILKQALFNLPVAKEELDRAFEPATE
ncbi:MAG: hypothetical protein NUV75_05785 [Gallionella sp.]|nr:hypothetical protein [Gallionella sp.]